MKIAALVSGGKDSIYAAWLAAKKHDLLCFVSLISKNPDSFMFHTENIRLVEKIAEACNLPLVMGKTKGEKEKELEDLKTLLEGLNIDGISVGAIASDYQYDRISKICHELHLKVFAPLWKIDAKKYMKSLIKNGFDVIITKVAAEGFDESWLGRKIDSKCLKDLETLNRERGIHIAGEGGEYETFVLDCPLYRKKIKITKAAKKWNKGVGSLLVKNVKLIDKDL